MNIFLGIILEATASLEYAWIVVLVGFVIVVSALALLFFVFSQVPVIMSNVNKRKRLRSYKSAVKQAAKERALKETEQAKRIDEEGIEGNVVAAISLAIHNFFNEMHDEEAAIVTIKKVRKAYSPWSSKIYGVMNNWPK
ncbi:MAG: OadG family transporter subunit [Bacteroidales bacterium]